MLRRPHFWLIVVISLLIHSTQAADVNLSPVGFWTLLDPKSNVPRYVLKVTKRANMVEGSIFRVYEKVGDFEFCVLCPAPYKNEPIVGLRILSGLKATEPLSWSGGHILDPQTGKEYRCKMTMVKTGKIMYLRAYYGLSIFGKTLALVRRGDMKG